MKSTWLLFALAALCVACKNYEEPETLDSDANVEQVATDGLEVAAPEVKSEEQALEPAPRIVLDLKVFDLDRVMTHLNLTGLALGMTKKEFKDLNIKANQYVEEKTSQTVGYRYQYYDISIGGVSVAELRFQGDLLHQIRLVSPQSTPHKMVGVGTNLASLRLVYPDLQLIESQFDEPAVASLNKNIMAEFSLEGSDTPKLEESSTISAIVIE